MCGFRRSVRHVVWCDLFRARRNVEHVDCAVEEGKGRNWLVEWNFVSRLVDPSERKVAVFSCLAVLHSVDCHGGVAGFPELGGTCVVRGDRDCLSAKPVADVIGVTVNERHSYRAVQDHF